jgi:vancomycin resistance protein VanJ
MCLYCSWAYMILFYIWLFIRVIFKDRWWLEFVNSLTLYWFLPLIITIPVAIFYQQPLLLLFSLAALFIFFLSFVYFFFPHRPFSKKCRKDREIKVMTFNILQSNQDADKIIQVILDSEADIVALQEVTQPVQSRISKELKHIYPYQAIERPPDSASWNGLISRIPIAERKNVIPGEWKTSPQVFFLSNSESPIVVINIHAYPICIGTLDLKEIIRAFDVRKAQAQMLIEYAQSINYPIIALGDFNTTDQNIPYKIITSQLVDSWRETGRGFGLTFGLRWNTFGLERPIPKLLPIPRWLFRIDYIFHSREWTVNEIKLLPSYNISDHRPVIASLGFNRYQ